jgi:tetratricopeptide (TPR) repeat protein
MSILKHLVRSLPLCGLYNIDLCQIVDGNSAKLDLEEPLEVIYQVPESNHSTICKFEGATEDYEVVIGYITKLVDWALTPPVAIPDVLLPPGSSSSTLPISPQASRSSLFDSDLALKGLASRRAFPRLSSYSRVPRDSEANSQPFYKLPNHIYTSKFTGRQSILDLVQGLLGMEHGGQTRIALYGLGGVGKTQIALKIVSWYQATYSRHSIFWLSGRCATAFRESLEDVAVLCGLVRKDDNTAQHLGQLYEFLSGEENGKWLVVIDNADSADAFGITSGLPKQDTVLNSHPSSPIIECIPECSHGQVLITTKSKIMGEKLSLHGHVEEVQPMEESESTLLFKRQFAEAPSSTTNPPTYQREIPTDQDIQKLCAYLGHLPLAITQAAAFMREQSQTITGYIELLETNEASIRALLDQKPHGYGVEDDFSKAVASTWKVAFDQIQSKWPRAADILSLMAFLDAEAIPKFLLKNFESDEFKLSVEGLGTLQGYALIYPGTTSETFRIHRLVQVAMRQRLSSNDSTGKWASVALKLLNDSFPNADNYSRKLYVALIPHAQQALRHDFSETVADRLLFVKLASNVSLFQLKDGHFAEAEMYGEKAWDQLKSVPNTERDLELNVKATWAQALRKVGQFDRAEALTKEAWTGQKKLHGSTSPQALQLASHLASVYQDQGYYDKAANIARETIQSLEKKLKDKISTLNDVNIRILDTKCRLVMILEKLGEYYEAEKVIQEVIKGYSAMAELGPDDPQILKCRWRLAYILHAKEMYEESETLAMETWTAQKRIIGENHADCVMTLLLIAENLESRGNFERALSIKKDIYSRAIILVGLEHIYTILAGESLASGFASSAAHLSRKEAAELYREAEGLYDSALVWSQKNLRPDHPNVLTFKTGLATVLRLQGQLQDAEDMQRGALKLKTGLSSDHPFTLAAEENLARILWEGRALHGGKEDKSKVKEAKKLALHILKAKEKKTGWRSRGTVRIAELVIEMPVDGKERVELQRKLDEQKTNSEEYGRGKAEDGGVSWEDEEVSDMKYEE